MRVLDLSQRKKLPERLKRRATSRMPRKLIIAPKKVLYLAGMLSERLIIRPTDFYLSPCNKNTWKASNLRSEKTTVVQGCSQEDKITHLILDWDISVNQVFWKISHSYLDSTGLVWRFSLLRIMQTLVVMTIFLFLFLFSPFFFFFFSFHALLQFHFFLPEGDAASLQHHFVYAILSDHTSMDTWKTTNTYLQSTW